jgi:hypothetical protein
MLTTAIVGDQKVSIHDYKKDGKSEIYPLCPLGHRLIAKKGKRMVHHFAHYSGEACDKWREGLTHWHYQWQNIVADKRYLEVCLDANGAMLGHSMFQSYGANSNMNPIMAQAQGHIADIVVPQIDIVNGQQVWGRPCVVEVQHSSINKESIMAREEYYKRMIWLFDFTPRLTTADKCNRMTFVDGNMHFLKEKVVYVAMISCMRKYFPGQGQSLVSPNNPNSTVQHHKTFDQIELYSNVNPSSQNSNNANNDSLMNMFQEDMGKIYIGDDVFSTTPIATSGFFMIVNTRTKYWFDTTKPTYFDTGFCALRYLMPLDDGFYLTQYLTYEQFIQERMPPVDQNKIHQSSWFKTLNPALLVKLKILPRIVDVPSIKICRDRVIIEHKGQELMGMGLHLGENSWVGGSYYSRSSNSNMAQSSQMGVQISTLNAPRPSSSNSDAMLSLMLSHATMGLTTASNTNKEHVAESLFTARLRKFLGVSNTTEIKIVTKPVKGNVHTLSNSKIGDTVIVICSKETYALKDKFQTLQMTYRKGASISSRKALRDTKDALKSAGKSTGSSGSASKMDSNPNMMTLDKMKSADPEAFEKEDRPHYRGKLKTIETVMLRFNV